MQEIWKDIKGYEGLYQVSNFGRVKSLHGKEKILKPYHKSTGYIQVILCKNYKTVARMVHRLVAEAFIPNPENKSQVNHKDENPLNNVDSNLEWCSATYNINYGTRNHKCMNKRGTPVKCVETRQNLSICERSC